MTYTQGPWEVLPIHNSEGAFGIYAEAEQAFIGLTVDGPAQAGNARLIAAAPEMFELLEEILGAFGHVIESELFDASMLKLQAMRAAA